MSAGCASTSTIAQMGYASKKVETLTQQHASLCVSGLTDSCNPYPIRCEWMVQELQAVMCLIRRVCTT